MELTDNWSENIIIVDGDYVDSVAFDMTVNFERMLNRRVHDADMALWLECVALDGGVRQGENSVQVIFLHNSNTTQMKMFSPGEYATDLAEKAFKGDLGEFTLSSFPAIENIVKKDDFFLDVVKTAANHKDVRRVMVVGNCDDGTLPARLRQVLRDVDDDKRITVFAMQPIPGGNYRTEILGYSLLKALGISASELSGIE